MPNYRRNYVEGGTYFFTVVTYKRQRLLTGEAIDILRECIRKCMSEKPFVIEAAVVLPEHLHCMIRLPEQDSDYSSRWKDIKGDFTSKYISKFGEPPAKPTAAMRKKGEKGIWQQKFWEHTIRDQDDYNGHIQYIHYNPVKHGLVAAPKDWPYSSFHRFVKRGVFSESWAGPVKKFHEGMGGE